MQNNVRSKRFNKRSTDERVDAFQSSLGLSLIVRDANSSPLRKKSEVVPFAPIDPIGILLGRVFPSRERDIYIYIDRPEILENVIGFYLDRPSFLPLPLSLTITAEKKQNVKGSKLFFFVVKDGSISILIISYIIFHQVFQIFKF